MFPSRAEIKLQALNKGKTNISGEELNHWKTVPILQKTIAKYPSTLTEFEKVVEHHLHTRVNEWKTGKIMAEPL